MPYPECLSTPGIKHHQGRRLILEKGGVTTEVIMCVVMCVPLLLCVVKIFISVCSANGKSPVYCVTSSYNLDLICII